MEYDEVYDAGLNLSSYWALAVFWSSALIYRSCRRNTDRRVGEWNKLSFSMNLEERRER